MTRYELLAHAELCILSEIRKVLDKIDAEDKGDGFYEKETGVEGGGTNSYEHPMAFIRLDGNKSVYADYDDGYGFCDIDNGDLNGNADGHEEPTLDEIEALITLDKWIKERL